MSLILGPHEFDTHLLMPDYKSERHPNGAVLKLSPRRPLDNAREFLAQYVREIMELTRINMALVIETDDASTFLWSAAASSDRGLFFHADGNIKDPPMTILLTPQIDAEWGYTDYRLNRAPTSVAEPHVVEAATRETLLEQKDSIREFGRDTVYGSLIEDMYENLEKYTTLRYLDEEVRTILTELGNAIPDISHGVWNRLRQREQVYEHDWKVQQKRTILAISNTEIDDQKKPRITALHGRKSENIYRMWGNVQRAFVQVEPGGTVTLRHS